MDGGDRRQSQYGAPYPSGRPPSQLMGPPAQEQYSQTAPSTTRSVMAAQTSARPYLPEYQYTYSQQPFQPQVQYPSTYIQEPSRSHQLQPPPTQQQYGSYGHGTMLPPVQQQSMYGNVSDYQQQQRQSAAIEAMTSQFGGGSIPQYMSQAEQGSGVGIGQSTSPYITSQPEQQPYGSISYGRQLQPPFAPSTSEFSMLEQQSLPQQTQEEATTRQATEEGRRQYEQQIRTVFDAIVAGRVTEASDKLLVATEWLLGSVRALGLHHDDEENYEQRILVWRELNHAWEALGMKQKSITENALRTRQQPPDLLPANAIHNLIDKLVQLCDQVEKYGLVDYEMGLWEEQIIDIFIQCLNILPREQARSDHASS